MGDYCELQLSLDLPESLPAEDLALLRWHVTGSGGGWRSPAYGPCARRRRRADAGMVAASGL